MGGAIHGRKPGPSRGVGSAAPAASIHGDAPVASARKAAAVVRPGERVLRHGGRTWCSRGLGSAIHRMGATWRGRMAHGHGALGHPCRAWAMAGADQYVDGKRPARSRASATERPACCRGRGRRQDDGPSSLKPIPPWAMTGPMVVATRRFAFSKPPPKVGMMGIKTCSYKESRVELFGLRDTDAERLINGHGVRWPSRGHGARQGRGSRRVHRSAMAGGRGRAGWQLASNGLVPRARHPRDRRQLDGGRDGPPHELPRVRPDDVRSAHGQAGTKGADIFARDPMALVRAVRAGGSHGVGCAGDPTGWQESHVQRVLGWTCSISRRRACTSSASATHTSSGPRRAWVRRCRTTFCCATGT